MKMKMTIVVAAAAVLVAGVCEARPHGGPGGFGGGHRPPPPVFHGGHHSHSIWGHGGSHFLPGFVGGVVGGALAAGYRPLAPAPVVVTPAPVVVTTPVVTTPVIQQQVVAAPVVQPVVQPTYAMQNVWVEGRYVDQVQANGTVVRVWQPGHYEQRQVVVQ